MLRPALKRFERGAKGGYHFAHFRHREVTDYGDCGGPYLVMESLPGGTLEARRPVPARSSPGKQRGCRFPSQKPCGSPTPHSIGRRTVQPSDLLMTTSGQPMLTDFGVAELSMTVPARGWLELSLPSAHTEYMAPEQLGSRRGIPGSPVRPSHSLLRDDCGRRPFEADTRIGDLVDGSMIRSLDLPVSDSLAYQCQSFLIKALRPKIPHNRYRDLHMKWFHF